MKRKDAINLIKYAGYHDDRKTATRLFVENRISRSSFEEAFSTGQKAKESGMSCHCQECSR